jgi:23S rRNA G2069 N7-methylase RlmK/C1962 C5-methylase RlmI
MSLSQIDRYGDEYVLQTPFLGMDARKATILEAMRRLWQPRAVVERNAMYERELEGLPAVSGTFHFSLY